MKDGKLHLFCGSDAPVSATERAAPDFLDPSNEPLDLWRAM
jgi:hypothetical protein